MALVFVCADGAGSALTGGDVPAGHTVPSCQSGSGAWVEQDQPFDPSTLDPAELGAAFGAGFVTFGTGLMLVLAMRLILKAIRTA